MSAQLHYLFTTDGGDREDGNVYYAQHLVVDVPSLASQAAVDKIIAVALEADHLPGYDINYALYLDDEPVDAVDLAATALEEAGYKVNTVTPTFVVGV